MFDPPASSPLPRRARRAADAALRAHLRRRDRLDRHARSALTRPPGGAVGRILGVFSGHAHA
jgi:hypothetical protein